MPRKTLEGVVGDPTTPAAAFNEAAARCRGKPDSGRDRRDVSMSRSMRPRPDAAENPIPIIHG